MTTLYHLEDFDLSKNLISLFNYLNTQAKTQPLHQIEHCMFKQLLEMGRTVLSQFVQKKISENNTSTIVKKEEILPLHSIKKRNYLSIFGNIEIARPYFWKRGSTGFFPVDEELNLPRHHHSYLLDKWIQHRVTEEPYEEAINSICDILDQKASKRLVQQITNQSSRHVEEYYQIKRNFPNEGSHLIVQADSKGVRMIPKERPKTKSQQEFVRRAKGVSKIGTRKNAVVTSDYSINPSLRTPKEVLEGLMTINSNKKSKKSSKKKQLSTAINKQVAGTMQGQEKAFKDLADRLMIRDQSLKKPIYILIDGAAPLEKGLKKEFKNRGWESRIIGCCLDIVHAAEYLWDASTAMYGEENPKRACWVRDSLEKVLSSNVHLIIEELEDKINNKKLSKFIKRRLSRSVNYLKNHQHMMDYKTYLKAGFPIASGAIEGACNNLIKDRTDRSGMQWTKKGAEAVIKLRSVQCNEDWENYWEFYIQKEVEELYEKKVA